jgi:hypothetical protein
MRNADWKVQMFVLINPQSEIRIPQFLILSILFKSAMALVLLPCDMLHAPLLLPGHCLMIQPC